MSIIFIFVLDFYEKQVINHNSTIWYSVDARYKNTLGRKFTKSDQK